MATLYRYIVHYLAAERYHNQSLSRPRRALPLLHVRCSGGCLGRAGWRLGARQLRNAAAVQWRFRCAPRAALIVCPPALCPRLCSVDDRVCAGGSYNVWGLPQPVGQQKGSVGAIGALGGGAWGAPSLPVKPIGSSSAAAGLPPPPAVQVGSTAQQVVAPGAPAVLPTAPPSSVAAAAPTLPSAAAPASGGGLHVVKCKGLPLSATIEKIEQFFDGLVRAGPPDRDQPNASAVCLSAPALSSPHTDARLLARSRYRSARAFPGPRPALLRPY